MPENRDKNGRFMKGNNANPGGRPKQNPEVKAILQAGTEYAAKRLVELTYDKNPKIALWAINTLFDRTMGKPTQAQNVQMDITGFLDVRAQVRAVLMERAKANEQRRIEGDNNE